MPDLGQLIDRARTARVADEDARAYVAELGRWARSEPAPRRSWWPAWLAGGLALAAAAIAIIVLSRPSPSSPNEPVQVGDRVALVAAPATAYRVIAADADHTEILVERGTVTARLFHGERAHRLALRGGAVEAYATGTVYSLTVEAGTAWVDVHEGTVEVVHDGAREAVPAGSTWPPSARHQSRAAADTLLALTRPTPMQPVVDAALVEVDAAVVDVDVVVDAVVVDAAAAPRPAVEPDPPKSLTDRWRAARLLRGQGDFDAAVRECLAIADAGDATWSPIALLEAARIELGPRASPERAIALAERFVREWPSHPLTPEARELRCRGLRQLGRDAECGPIP